MTSRQPHSQGTLQGTFEGANAVKLFYQGWYPNFANGSQHDSVRGVLALVHGLGEHSGRYANVIAGLTASGYAVFSFDNQGHGRSDGQRGHINQWQDYRDNIRAFLHLVRQREPEAPLFLMGHSLGGLIVLDYVLRNQEKSHFRAFQIQGMVVSAPPIQPTTMGPSKLVRIATARLLSGIFPRLSLKMDLHEGALSRDPEVIVQMKNDPLTHTYVTVRWGTEFLRTKDWVKDNFQQLMLPILIIHGDADPLIDAAGSQALFDQLAPVADKTLYLYPGSYHEPHNDLDAAKVVSDLLDWLEAHQPDPSSNTQPEALPEIFSETPAECSVEPPTAQDSPASQHP